MGETAPAATPSPSPPLPPTPPLPPGRLTVIGVGHVFRIEDAVREAIAALRPDVVFVELDRGRLEALLARRRGDKMPEGEGFWQKRLQRFQEGVAGLYGAQPGAEMVAAVEGARAVGARVLLIDPPAQDTVRRALRALTWRERLRAARMAAGGLLRSLWPSRGARAAIEAEIKRYQEDPEAALEELRRTFPTLHRIVIAERDELMARRIRRHLAGAAHGVAVLGDGHVGGILRSLAGLD
ncbi:MAG TPA: TraB domain-containing protein, partial [Candidatus Thermoplasmatota archaeon]|nr:TraB domain-containing protein [Candidatus Thermoplasmatota archaeon]